MELVWSALKYSTIAALLNFCIIEIGIWRYIKWSLSRINNVKKEPEWKQPILLPPVFGLLEVTFYSSAFIHKVPEFVVVWLGVKTAYAWFRKPQNSNGVQDNSAYDNVLNRGMHYSFLIGSALSILWSVIIADQICPRILRSL